MISGILEKISPNSADLTQARAVRAVLVPGTKWSSAAVSRAFFFFPQRGAPPLEGGGAPQRTTSDSLRVLPASSIASARANFVSRAKMPSKKVRRARLPRDARRFRPPTALLVGHTWSATPSSVSWGRQSKLHLLRVLFLSKRCG